MTTRSGWNRDWTRGAVLSFALSAGACAAHEPPANNAAEVQLAIRQAPADAACLRVSAVGTKNVSQTIGLSPGQNTVFSMGNLPTGSVVFSAEAFDQPCALSDFSSPSYVSDHVASVLKPGKNGQVVLTMGARASASVAVEFPGEEKGRWVGIAGAPIGTPAAITSAASNDSESVFDIAIAGYFLEEKTGPDGAKYTRMSIPGLGTFGQVGAPDLPVVRMDLAVPTSVRAVSASAEILASVELQNFVAWPAPQPGSDQTNAAQELGFPDRFSKDDKIYAGQRPFPADTVAPALVSAKLGSIRGASVEVNPAVWDPTTNTLKLATQMRVTFDHKGTFDNDAPITQERNLSAAAKFANWTSISRFISVNALFFAGDFLFIYPPGYQDEMAPLVSQKAARGFAVTERTLAETGGTCASIRAAIATWYASRSAARDKFAILVGDTAQIPLCAAPTGAPSDDLYGDADGDGVNDLDEEVYVGRLSVNSEADAATQVDKILRYEDHAELFFNYGRTLLVAHKEEAPGKYVGAHESVRTAAYTVPPTFSTLYGHISGVNDADVTSAINGGMGLVAYRGHGSSNAWTGWNTANEYYDTSDVSALNNALTQTPVVWSFACNNAELDVSDSIGEVWMANSKRGVAHYGSTIPSGTYQNHELDRQMFQAVFTAGLTTHGRAIERGEAQMAAISGASGNAWMYLLLGDPEMRLRRGPKISFTIRLLEAPRLCPNGNCGLPVSILDEKGNPAPNVLVSAYKPGTRLPEVFDNRYTDEKGTAILPASIATPGAVTVSVRDLAGNGDAQTIIVQ
ncbi:MAG: C25 family cysteine peptidase [Deltaproteobacteria bacterium]|nr:C25 family cysteine peptidase [Deltaproteobacteria bacterium]